MSARRLRDVVLFLVITLALVALCEGGTRVVIRLQTGTWPETQLAMFYHGVKGQVSVLFRSHPWLNVAPREGAVTTRERQTASFNRLGYRSPERPLAKPAGTRRVLCAGGSTTFDVSVTDDEHSWPWQLDQRMADLRPPVEVWNAGFPGWTSLENAISLVVRDVDLEPDVVILYQGINDLQPASATPFNRQYEGLHPEAIRTALAVEPGPLPLWERSVFLETVRARLFGGRKFEITPVKKGIQKVASIPDEAVQVFARNVRSILDLTRGRDALLVLVTQPVRLRSWSQAIDVRTLELWVPGLPGAVVPRELERMNEVLRGFADERGVLLLDAARDVKWADTDFRDAMHFGNLGSAKLASFLAFRLRPLFAARR